MKMLSFVKNHKSIFGLVFVLVLPTSLADTNNVQHIPLRHSVTAEPQQISILENADAPNAIREDFWFPRMVWPVKYVNVSSGFGYRSSACGGCSSNHQGTDFTQGQGAQIFSVMEGVVELSGPGGSFGTHVIVLHPNGWKTLYAHMVPGSNAVSVGDKVNQGQIIGLVGNSGTSTGPHLHFEIIIDGVSQNPMPLLNKWTNMK
jgi:murein DD-endopeptidase MepM/ murein hydrolase activator NlpD